jgi:tetratricopeptide (TPR) repeat protein
MNAMKILTAATVITILAVSIIKPQATPVNDLLKEGKAISQQANAHYDQLLLLKAKSVFEQAYAADTTNPLPLYYITYTGYKLLEMNLRDKDAFEKYYEETEKNGLQLSETKGMESEGKTLLASIYMMKIANSPMSAISLSSTIFNLLGEAEKANAKNPRIYIVRGSMKFNMPKMFGGSYSDAADNFRKSVSLFEKEEIADSLQPSWGYLESLAWLGRSYEQLENYEAAKFIYQKALSIEPEFGWVKYNLLPALEKNMSSKNK